MYTTLLSEPDEDMKILIREVIGEARRDQRRHGEMTAQVQKLQQVRGAAAMTAARQSTTKFRDTRLRESQVFRGRGTKRQEWYFECSGDRYLGSGTEVDDTSQRTMDTTRWEDEQTQVSRHWFLILAKRKEVLQVDLGTDERTCTDRAVQWEERIREFETVSSGTWPDVVTGAIFTERSPPAINLSVNA